jgi:serine/threonine protein kinase
MLFPPDIMAVLSTLESIHRVGILHGDIRRENMLVDGFGLWSSTFGIRNNVMTKKPRMKNVHSFYLLGLGQGSD